MHLTGLLSLLPYMTLDHLSRGGLGPPTSIINQENSPTDLPMGQSGGNIFSIEATSFQMTLASIHLT